MTLTVPGLTIPSRLPRPVEQDWVRLAAGTPAPVGFAPAMLAELPEPARRWLTHAIARGTPLRRSVSLAQHGQIRLGSWHAFRATQVLAPPDGFVWAVATSVLGLPVTGFDRYTRGTGQLRHRLFGLVPVASAVGSDITRSAAGRLASEIVFVPATALVGQVRWRPVDEHRATVLVPVGGHIHAVTLRVADSGALEQVSTLRWARLGRAPFREHPFTVVVHEEATFEGYTIPARITAGYEPDRDFVRLMIDNATYR